MKKLLIIADGMADKRYEELGGLSPIEAAFTPFLDSLALKGTVASARTVPEGLSPGSDVAIMSIFGVDPILNYTGRAPLELANLGMKVKPGGAAFRCNLCTLEGEDEFKLKTMLSHSAGSIEGSDADALLEFLNSHPSFKELLGKYGMSLIPTGSFRGLAVTDKADLSGLNLFPPHDNLGAKVGQILPCGAPLAATLSEIIEASNKFLSEHPLNKERTENGKLSANAIWFWAEGKGGDLPSFTEKYSEGAVISAVPLVSGIAELIGLEKVSIPTATGEWDTDYAAKTRAAIDLLEKYDFVGVHLEGPDEASHNFDLGHKVFSLECISELCLRPIVNALKERGEDFRLLFISDHYTYTDTGAHGGKDVPYLLYDSRVDTGKGILLSEENADSNNTGSALKLMDMLFSD